MSKKVYEEIKIEFALAEIEGDESIKALAERKFNEVKDDYKKLTDFIMAVNHLSWEWHMIGNEERTQLYSDLYYEYDEKAIDYLEKHNTEEEVSYFFRTLD